MDTQNTFAQDLDLLTDYLGKTLSMSRDALKFAQEKNVEELNQTLDNRERIINILMSLHERVSMHLQTQPADLAEQVNAQINQIIEQIDSLDDAVTSFLLSEKNKTQFEIAKTHKNKENFKGYNLNKLK